MIVLVFLLSMMAALAISVILRQRKDMAAFRHCNNLGTLEEKQKRQKPRLWPWFTFSRPAKHRPNTAADSGAGAEDKDSPTAVGTLHAACVLLAAAPCQVFSPPMAMHFRIPIHNSSHSKTVLIIGVPWLPALACGA